PAKADSTCTENASNPRAVPSTRSRAERGRPLPGPVVQVLIRSILFNALFYLNLIVHLFAALPTLVLPRGALLAVVRFWARTNLWLLRAVCGITAEFRGIEKIPGGPLLVASKHQSTWETFALILLFGDPAFILKRELMWLPFFGWYAWKADMIPV